MSDENTMNTGAAPMGDDTTNTNPAMGDMPATDMPVGETENTEGAAPMGEETPAA